MADSPQRTPEEIAAMRAEIAAIDAAKAEAAREKVNQDYAPMISKVQSDAMATVREDLQSLMTLLINNPAAYGSYPRLYSFVESAKNALELACSTVVQQKADALARASSGVAQGGQS